MWLTPPSQFTDMPLKMKERNISTKHISLKNRNWREADQLVIYKHDRGVELGSTKKQLQLSGQSCLRKDTFLQIALFFPRPASCSRQLGLITSRCSGKEPALLPRTHSLLGEGRPDTRERRKPSLVGNLLRMEAFLPNTSLLLNPLRKK